ncbi:MAG: type I methionyl aminopeptidase [Candidatus Saccharimonadales bacterium]
MTTKIKTAPEIRAMRESGRMLATVLKTVSEHTVAGVSTKDLAVIAANELKSLGGQPSFLGYQGFPDVICISINDEVVHGIPSPNRLVVEGDIVGLDFGVTYMGMITDSAVSVGVGQIRDSKKLKMLQVTKQSLSAAINVVHNKVRVGDVGAAVESVVRPYKFGIVRDLVGHGVGHDLHEDPNIPNYGQLNTGPWLTEGMTIAIEPMITLGSEKVYVMDDGWTIKTVDGSWSAHFEHTILVLEGGAEVLTKL